MSSLLATANDGLVYRGLLSIVAKHYGLAALGGAVMGAIMNFSVNRSWTFRGQWKDVRWQAIEYAIGATLTYLGLSTALFVLVGRFGVDPKTAWLPAKVAAFAFISYPFQRFLVFRIRGRRRRWTLWR